MPPGQLQANLWQSADIFIGSCSQCTGLISTNPCHQINHHLGFFFFLPPKCILSSVCAKGMLEKRLLIRWSPEHHSTLPGCACFDGQWWKHRWMWESSPCCGLLICGFLLAQEWRFAVWLLGTVGQCSQSSVCSLACRAPRVSLAPEGRQTKAPLSHTLKSLSNTFVFYTQRGTFLFWGEEL